MSKGVLVAEGDSWFKYGPDFLLKTNVVYELEKLGYEVRSVAHYGHTLKRMPQDFEELKKKLKEVAKEIANEEKRLKAILFSGGGNDITGKNLEALLIHSTEKREKPSALNQEKTNKKMGKLCCLYEKLIKKTVSACDGLFGNDSAIPVLVHGYGHPVPDGRGFTPDTLKEEWALPDWDCWLKKAFDNKGYESLEENTETMEELVDKFNEMLTEDLPKKLGDICDRVRHVELRGLISNKIEGEKFKKDWENELHPTPEVFKKIAEKFDEEIVKYHLGLQA